MKCSVVDRVAITDLLPSLTERVITDEGYLIAPAKIATSENVQRYRARELGLDKSMGMPGDKIITLFRPAAEVLSAETLRSFDMQTLTNDHPPEGVDAENWTKVARGMFFNVKAHANGRDVAAMVKVCDKATVKDCQDGKGAMSCGYDFDLDLTPGKTTDGVAYDGVQRKIRGNHLAIVDSGRGGPALRIADHDERTKTMRKIRCADVRSKLLGIAIPGFAFDLDGDGASRTDDEIAAHSAAVADTITKLEEARAEVTAQTKRADAADAQVAELKTKLEAEKKRANDAEAARPKPEQIEAMAAERSTVVDSAALIAPDLKPAGLTVEQIRTQAVAAILANDSAPGKLVVEAVLASDGETDPAKAKPAVVKAAFQAGVSAAKAASANDGAGAAAGTGSANDSADDARTAARDAALAGSQGNAGGGTGGGFRAPRLTGMDAVQEIDRLHRIGRHDEARKLQEEASA